MLFFRGTALLPHIVNLLCELLILGHQLLDIQVNFLFAFLSYINVGFHPLLFFFEISDLVAHLQNLALHVVYVLLLAAPLLLPLLAFFVDKLFIDVKTVFIHNYFALVLTDQPFNLSVCKDSQVTVLGQVPLVLLEALLDALLKEACVLAPSMFTSIGLRLVAFYESLVLLLKLVDFLLLFN